MRDEIIIFAAKISAYTEHIAIKYKQKLVMKV
jgi:hypothetical protein